MSFTVGSLVKARGREWVVLPQSSDVLLVLRPLGGSDDEITGIHRELEEITSATFDLPDPNQVGDYRSARLLRDAVRLGFRSSAGPFRSFARLGFEPRPYQLVPLLMALKLDPVRLLIADDVGIGKTIEAGLIARELLDRGEIQRMAVLCPPPLAEQWQAELQNKFHIETELVLPSTAARLERDLDLGESVFDRYPKVVVSLDYIKSDRHREDFLRLCPELVIVDEAHTCAFGAERGGRHQRYQLVRDLAVNPERHVILATGTPHSGNENAFRSLLGILDRDFDKLPQDLTGAEHERQRKRLAQHFVQRRRSDIRRYLEMETPFPERQDREETYKLNPAYRKVFERVLDYARESVLDASGTRFHQRVRWWSALALLRALASSPAAAAATLRTRAAFAAAEDTQEADELGRRAVLDLVEDETSEGADVTPGANSEWETANGETTPHSQLTTRRLQEMAREAEALQGDQDEKLKKAVPLLKELLDEGYRPIVFCRFIDTAEYLASELRQRLPKKVAVSAVTGTLPPAERVERIAQLAVEPLRILVATDCLSEGINLQEHFDAVMHYDLSWNPTRHEQREGRVDRYGQNHPTVRVLTYYGVDNQIDGVVLDVLLRKHKKIRSSLGISVPVPVDTEQVIQAIFEGLLLKGQKRSTGEGAMILPGMEDFFAPQMQDLYGKWEAASEREKRSRTLFAQETIKTEEVARELQAVRNAIGSGVDVAAFTRQSLSAFGAIVRDEDPLQADFGEASSSLRTRLGIHFANGELPEKLQLKFSLPFAEDELYLPRTHPFVESLANHVLETALDPLSGDSDAQNERRYPAARRCGAIRTSAVSRRTTLLVARFRYHITQRRQTSRGEMTLSQTAFDPSQAILAEECLGLAFAGAPENAEWLNPEEAERLLQASPEANIAPEQASSFIRRVVEGMEQLRPRLEQTAAQRADELLKAHQRVRQAARQRGVRTQVEPQLPVDVLGIYVFLPM
jgi:superfamily II DNA or RNA helicase